MKTISFGLLPYLLFDEDFSIGEIEFYSVEIDTKVSKWKKAFDVNDEPLIIADKYRNAFSETPHPPSYYTFFKSNIKDNNISEGYKESFAVILTCYAYDYHMSKIEEVKSPKELQTNFLIQSSRIYSDSFDYTIWNVNYPYSKDWYTIQDKFLRNVNEGPEFKRILNRLPAIQKLVPMTKTKLWSHIRSWVDLYDQRLRALVFFFDTQYLNQSEYSDIANYCTAFEIILGVTEKGDTKNRLRQAIQDCFSSMQSAEILWLKDWIGELHDTRSAYLHRGNLPNTFFRGYRHIDISFIVLMELLSKFFFNLVSVQYLEQYIQLDCTVLEKIIRGYRNSLPYSEQEYYYTDEIVSKLKKIWFSQQDDTDYKRILLPHLLPSEGRIISALRGILVRMNSTIDLKSFLPFTDFLCIQLMLKCKTFQIARRFLDLQPKFKMHLSIHIKDLVSQFNTYIVYFLLCNILRIKLGIEIEKSLHSFIKE